ncbi:MAG TPA: lipopolysaccharide transport periplasmic protein LptA [Xanthomonadaceae bacterium]|nr:lipopolysaccharide transport periplasmic protein LptA [Xanthomonadaceae bacterium]
MSQPNSFHGHVRKARHTAGFVLALVLVVPAAVEARRDDRNQPMDIDAQRTESSTRGDAVTVLSGDVRITQGSMKVGADRAEVHQDRGQIVKVILEGRPVTFEQELDDDEGMLYAEALRVDYDTTLDRLLLTGQVHIRQPRGEMTSERIEYNLETGRVTSGGDAGDGRVRLRIEPLQERRDGKH